jgi:DNA-directed RNA polymerase I, II, and III subunit RPABC2
MLTDPVAANMFNDLSDDEDNEDQDDENYLQKFDDTLQQQIIADYHPELQSHTYDEITTMARVVRDKRGNVIDPLHQTLPFITRYEKARILGERAKQINAGAKPFVEVEGSVIDGYLIALGEFEQKKIPFMIKRPLPNGGCEYWKLSDLEILI